ncbi:hypothetical protein WKI13_04125 [Teredinibacter turnerae]|uniref:hypothetical protein n=1 Tax=Teredinibacter turnerae TaxID=2426 RepID=UPI00036F69A1|nr:hypothetical protein [Teredinibacter turnerae]
MAHTDRLISHLPSLYRPQAGDAGILTDLLGQWGAELDNISDQMTQVMQAHWHGTADRAIYNPYFNRARQQQKLPPLSANTPLLEERRLLNEFPFICDLARLGALLELPVWREPPQLRENVESYRARLQKMFLIYRNGLGTLAALRAMVEASLPLAMGVPVVHRHRPFAIEEYAPLGLTEQAAIARGAPLDAVGPLMRWELRNQGLQASAPTAYIEGVAPVAGEYAATERPALELMGAPGQPSVSLAYHQSLAPGEVLRLAPVPMGFLATGNDLLQAQGSAASSVASTAASTLANTRADSGWQALAEFTGTSITHLAQTRDHTLWAVVDNAGNSELWRYKGANWLRVQSGFAFANITLLRALDFELFIGDANGLHIIHCLPEVEDDYTLQTSPWFNSAVYDMLLDDGLLWFATEEGVFTATPNAATASATPVQSPTYCIAIHAQRSLYFGGALGVVHLHKGYNRWTHLIAESASDLDPAWQTFNSAAPATSYVPPVSAIASTADGTLWLGTAQGLARFFAARSSTSGLVYSPRLQAFPDLMPGRVTTVASDPSGLVWFGGENGLLRFDGRDFLEYLEAEDIWQSLGAADAIYPDDVDPAPRERWRFNTTLLEPAWEQFDSTNRSWNQPDTPLRSNGGREVNALLWCHSLRADLGSWNGANFVPGADSAVPLTEFSVRVKRSATEIVNGGIPALPMLPAGRSTWRYLSQEVPPLQVPVETPWWSTEGRLVPNGGATITPYPGRFRLAGPDPVANLPAGLFDDVVYAYLPAAKVRFSWPEQQPFSLLVRLTAVEKDEVIHPAVLDRVWQGMQKVKPAGARLMLAVENDIVRGLDV